MRWHPLAALLLVAVWLPLAMGIHTLVRADKVRYEVNSRGKLQSSDEVLDAAARPRKRKRRRNTAAPAPAPPINVVFGGSKRQDWTKSGGDFDGFESLDRPEAVKSNACDSNGCQSCTDPDLCFHGLTKSDEWGYLTLNVEKDAPFTHYTAEIWAHCKPGANAEWWIWSSPSSLSNGRLDVLVDKAGGGTREVVTDWKPGSNVEGGQYILISAAAGTGKQKANRDLTTEGAKLRLVFYPDSGKDAKAEVYIEGKQMDSSVDACMGLKDCLNQMGDGSKPSFQLRNDNDEQLNCLTGNTQDMSDSLKQKCKKWRTCVKAMGRKAQIVGLITAATMTHPALFAEDQTDVTLFAADQTDVTGCLNPAIDDPESWDCECHATWTATCQEPQNAAKPLESCLNGIMCSNTRICNSWKQAHCPASLVDSSMMQRSSANSSQNRDFEAKQSFDDSLQAKCTG